MLKTFLTGKNMFLNLTSYKINLLIQCFGFSSVFFDRKLNFKKFKY